MDTIWDADGNQVIADDGEDTVITSQFYEPGATVPFNKASLQTLTASIVLLDNPEKAFYLSLI